MKILITEPKDFNDQTLTLLKKFGEVRQGPFSRKKLLHSISNVNVLVVRLGHMMDEELLEVAKDLRFILTPTTGLNHIDLNGALRRGIQIVSLKGETDFLSTIPSTAEHTLALILSMIRQIPAAHQDVLTGEWNRDKFKAHNLSYYKLGILGFGRVGKQMAEYAKSLGMSFVFYDISPDYYHHPNCIKDLKVFMKEIDILSIHIPSSPENHKFLNESNLNYLKSGGFIVNTSRGEVIDELFILNLLKSKKLQGLAVDVVDSELQSDLANTNVLIKAAGELKNIIITPHVAGATFESMWQTEDFIVKKWIDLISPNHKPYFSS